MIMTIIKFLLTAAQVSVVYNHLVHLRAIKRCGKSRKIQKVTRLQEH